eukprot:7384093-Prymnesium_polylepis.1
MLAESEITIKDLQVQLRAVTFLPKQLIEHLVQVLRETGAAGRRRYATGQLLAVRVDNKWRDADVVAAPAVLGGREHSLLLSPLEREAMESRVWRPASN